MRNEIAQDPEDPSSENQLLREKSKDSEKKEELLVRFFRRKFEIIPGSEKKKEYSAATNMLFLKNRLHDCSLAKPFPL